MNCVVLTMTQVGGGGTSQSQLRMRISLAHLSHLQLFNELLVLAALRIYLAGVL